MVVPLYILLASDITVINQVFLIEEDELSDVRQKLLCLGSIDSSLANNVWELSSAWHKNILGEF